MKKSKEYLPDDEIVDQWLQTKLNKIFKPILKKFSSKLYFEVYVIDIDAKHKKIGHFFILN